MLINYVASKHEQRLPDITH